MSRFLSGLVGGSKPNIFWVTPALAVGGAEMAAKPKRLSKLGIRAVLDMRAESEDLTEHWQRCGIGYMKTPVVDFGAPNQQQLEEATAWVLDSMQRDEPVFIHCLMGLGRSVTMALATLLRMGYDLPTAYQLVRRQRPEILLSESQLASLRTFAERVGQAGSPD